jgi:hypothetical protein
MTSNLPMAISGKRKEDGYIYLVKINGGKYKTPNCYKIGYTKDVYHRLYDLCREYWGNAELIAYGYTHKKTMAEKHLHLMFTKDFWRGTDEALTFYWSTEYFNFNEAKLQEAIKMLGLVTSSIYIEKGQEHYSTPSQGDLAKMMKERSGI